MTYHIQLAVVEDGARSALRFESAVILLGRAIDNDIRLSAPLV